MIQTGDTVIGIMVTLDLDVLRKPKIVLVLVLRQKS